MMMSLAAVGRKSCEECPVWGANFHQRVAEVGCLPISLCTRFDTNLGLPLCLIAAPGELKRYTPPRF